MSQALEKIVYRRIGIAATYEQLTKLKLPVIVYLDHRKTEHFSVLRGATDDMVILSDPSLGNSTYSK